MSILGRIPQLARRRADAHPVLGVPGRGHLRGASRSASSAARPGTSSAWKPRCRSPATTRPLSWARCRSCSTRDEATASSRAFENRCAHRGALICIKSAGNARRFACVYHNWTYDLRGQSHRRPVPARHRGPRAACRRMRSPESDAPRKLRVATYRGLVFGTLSDATPPIEEYLGAEIAERIRRVMKEPVKVLGGYSQMLPNNWKLYLDNVKDTYHASLLHLVLHDVPAEPPGAEGRRHRRRRRRQPRELHDGAHRHEGDGIRESRRALGERRLPAGSARAARVGGRDRRRHHAADPRRLPRLRAAADQQQPRGAPGDSQGRRPHRARRGPASASRATTRP